MSKHRLTILGGPSDELRVSACVLNEALGALIDGARLATRFAIEGESVRKGPRPSWLDTVCDFEITGLHAGSAVIELQARALREVEPTRFGLGAQRSLFSDDDRLGEQTAIEIFGQLLASLIDDDQNEISADRPLLDACARFARVTGSAFEGLRIEGLRNLGSPLLIKPAHAPRIERLRDETPRPQAVRVAGTLDTVSASRADVVLMLPDATRIAARLEDARIPIRTAQNNEEKLDLPLQEHNLEALRLLLGKEVVVSGMAHYSPSSRLLRLEVEALELARPEDRIFQRLPIARKRKLVVESMAQDAGSGVSAFFGTWPGEESDEELLAALGAIR